MSDTSDSERGEESRPVRAAPGCLAKIGYAVVWILLYGFTLSFVGNFLNERWVKPDNREGYGALLGMGSVFFFVPFGLFISLIVLSESKRPWVFLAMAVGLACAIASCGALM